MAPTLYASFDTVEQAQHAINALVQGGTPASDIRLACKTAAPEPLNPAQNDYPRTGDAAAELSSAPPAAPRDYNAGIESDEYNRDYDADVQRDINRDNPDAQQFGAMPQTFPDLRASGPGNSSGDPSMGTPGTRYAGLAATAGATTDPGRMTDQLWGALPPDIADRYRRMYEDGKAILVVESPTPEAERILMSEGGRVQRQGYMA